LAGSLEDALHSFGRFGEPVAEEPERVDGGPERRPLRILAWRSR
jgi:hypothetical protein